MRIFSYIMYNVCNIALVVIAIKLHGVNEYAGWIANAVQLGTLMVLFDKWGSDEQ